MYWLDNNTGIPTPPSTPAVVSPSKRYFTNGGAGVQPSTPEDFWFHMVQEELLGVLTLAGITPVKNDLGQLAKAIQSIAFSAYPVGAPIPWPTATPPAGFLAMKGQSFSAATYPLLALAYPSLVLPDMRAEFIRGWDNARGIDVGRVVLSSQQDAIRNLIGSIQTDNGWMITGGTGVMRPNGSQLPLIKNQTTTGAVSTYAAWDMDASRAVPTASENRPRSVAFNYIVRAA